MAKRHEEMAREFMNSPPRSTSWEDTEELAALLARVEREALERAAKDLSFWHAQLNADWNESPTEYKDGLRDGCEFAERRVRALTEEG